MGSQPQVGWLGRTFGLTNTPDAWLARLGVVGWAAGLWLLLSYAARWQTGEIILALTLWGLVLVVAARHAVRDMFGPVFFYEVVRVARRRMTFFVRFLYVGCVACLLALMMFAWLEDIGYFDPKMKVDLVSTQKLSEFATTFFEVFAVVSYCTVAALTPVYVAGAIAVEKERKTLEFLLATDLRNREIVFGKVAARVMTLLGFALAGLPILAVLQLFGGIDPNQLLALFAATVITVVGLAAISIWMSAMLRRSRDAILLTYMLVVVYVFVSFFLAMLAIIPQPWTVSYPEWGIEFTLPSWLPEVMFGSAAGNPVVVLIRTMAPIPGKVPIQVALRDFTMFWGLVTAVSVGWAVVRLRAVALAQSYGPVAQPRAKKVKGKTVRTFPEVGDNPVFWKEVFVDSGFRGGMVWRILSVLVVLFIALWPILMTYFILLDPKRSLRWTTAQQWYEYTTGMNAWARVVLGIVGTLLFFAVAVRASAAISGEKDRDTWISLVGSPLSADAILWGKWWGCMLGMRKALFALLLVYCLSLAVGSIHPLTVLPTVYAVFTFLSVFTWVGLYCSMRASNSLVASIQTFFVTAFLAGGFWLVLGMCCALPLNILGVHGRTLDRLAQFGVGCTPPLIVGFLPFRTFDDHDLGPFRNSYVEGFGLWSLGAGLGFWTVVNLLLMSICLSRFRRMTNRVPLPIPAEKLKGEPRPAVKGPGEPGA